MKNSHRDFKADMGVRFGFVVGQSVTVIVEKHF